ncbi:unnamed protein product [Prunus armeniaca]
MLLGLVRAFIFRQLQTGWTAVKGRWMKLSPVPKFKDHAPKMLRKDREALGNTLVTFTNENNKSLQINFLAWHEKLVAWEQNCYEFTEEKTKCSWGKMGIKVGDEEFAERFG